MLSTSIAGLAIGFGCSSWQSSGDGDADSGEGGAPEGGSDAGGADSGGVGGMSGGSSGVSGSTCGEDSGQAGETSGEGGAPQVAAFWDWHGVVGTGQSLAVGQNGLPAKATTQPYGNLKLNTGAAAWPIDPEDASFELVPLTEPIGRRSTTYPSSYPTNIAGETPHAAMANQITTLVTEASGADYVGVHGEFGENGQCMTFLRKGATPSGVNGRAYEATLLETQAVTRLAAAEGKTYGVAAVIVTHGECDVGNGTYDDALFQLWTDYNTDIPAITGQTQNLLMIVSQQNAVNNRAASTLAQWRAGVEHPDEIVCSGPKYQYPYSSDSVHLVTAGYEQLGEKYGQVYFERVVLGRNWQPLQPTGVERMGPRSIRVRFHVPVPPLVWETSFPPPLQSVPEWQAGKGFEIRGPLGSRVPISSAEICGDAVVLTSDADLPPSGLFVGYALTGEATAMTMPFRGTFRWGLLRDSDPFVGSTTGTAQPNYSVAFELPIPE